MTITTTITTTDRLAPASLLRLLQLGSAALPVGAFAYSQGLEQAVARGEVGDRQTAQAWVTGLFEYSVLSSDVPLLGRLHGAWQAGNAADVRHFNDILFACRGSRELRAEERQIGAALARLLLKLGVSAARPWTLDERSTFANAFALAAVSFGIPVREAALGYVFAWAEAQVGAATRLIPLGQSDAQLVLSALIERMAPGIDADLERGDAEIGSAAPGQALLSALHETQYSRLFRS
jgi:urease accessory protein